MGIKPIPTLVLPDPNENPTRPQSTSLFTLVFQLHAEAAVSKDFHSNKEEGFLDVMPT